MRNSLISSALLALTAGVLSFSANTAPAPDANSVLILGPTVTGGMGSVEAAKVVALGKTPVVVDALTWSGMTTAEFKSYRALVLGDPTCGGVGTSPYLDAAIANRATWSPAVDGNVIIIGTDEVFHDGQGGNQLSESAVAFAADEPAKTGLMASMSCYYHGTAEGTAVPLLDLFGDFRVKGVGCYNDVHIVAVHPALAGTTDTTLSNWSCSVHEAFDAFPPSFTPLAIAKGAIGSGVLTFADGTSGIPYILARGETISPILCGNGIVEETEMCDDGNTENGDGCSAQCKIELPTNEAPDCSAAQPNPSMLWPPNHKMTTVSITGITDPDLDPLTVAITGVTQDEPVQGKGSGNTAPDAIIHPDGTADIRAERTGAAPHNGRVYELSITATDPDGLFCERKIQVCVPHDMRNPHECVDDGQNYISTAP